MCGFKSASLSRRVLNKTGKSLSKISIITRGATVRGITPLQVSCDPPGKELVRGALRCSECS